MAKFCHINYRDCFGQITFQQFFDDRIEACASLSGTIDGVYGPDIQCKNVPDWVPAPSSITVAGVECSFTC